MSKSFSSLFVDSNGCKDVKIKNSEVGPSARDVPVLATFSNSRFIQFFTDTLIPDGFQTEPEAMRESLMALFEGTMTFGDRPDAPVTLKSVFDRNSDAVELFRMYSRGESVDSLTEDQKSLLEEAKLVFGNRVGLADGSAHYGILFNRRGTPTTVSTTVLRLLPQNQ